MNPFTTSLLELYTLKSLPRTGWVRAQINQPETVASHSFGVACLALLLCPPRLDRARCVELALLHDWAEARVGDLTPHDPVTPEEKHRREWAAFQKMTQALPDAERLCALFGEYESGQTPEARFVRALDKLDMGLQAKRYAEQGRDLTEFLDSARKALAEDEGLLALLS